MSKAYEGEGGPDQLRLLSKDEGGLIWISWKESWTVGGRSRGGRTHSGIRSGSMVDLDRALEGEAAIFNLVPFEIAVSRCQRRAILRLIIISAQN